MTVDTKDAQDDTLMIRIHKGFRDKVAAMAERMFITGKRCHRKDGREFRPHQSALIEAAWEVAQRYPQEFSMAVMRRTEPREHIGVRADHLASGHRPR